MFHALLPGERVGAAEFGADEGEGSGAPARLEERGDAGGGLADGAGPNHSETELRVDAVGERYGDAGHPVGEERAHGDERCGVDLGEDGGDSEVRVIEREGGVERRLGGVDARLERVACALREGLARSGPEGIEGGADRALELGQHPELVVGGGAGKRYADGCLGLFQEPVDLGGGFALDAGKGAGAFGALPFKFGNYTDGLTSLGSR